MVDPCERRVWSHSHWAEAEEPRRAGRPGSGGSGPVARGVLPRALRLERRQAGPPPPLRRAQGYWLSTSIIAISNINSTSKYQHVTNIISISIEHDYYR